MAKVTSPVKVVMLPWLAYGHISPFLELAKRLSHRNTHTYLCSTPINLTSIKNKIPEIYSSSIHLIELHLPSSPELPPHYHTTNGLPLHLNSALRKALDSSKSNFSNILKKLQPDVVIHDAVIDWAAKVAFKDDISAVSFLTSGAMLCSFFCHSMMKPPRVEYPFPAIRLAGIEKHMFDSHVESFKKKSQERNHDNDDDDVPNQKANQTMLIKTSRAIEGKYIDYLSELINKKIVPVGALVGTDAGNDDENSDLMEWLDKKDEFSTVFLSFGSEYFLKNKEVEEIAYSLEHSNVNFIWVLRFPGGEKIRAPEVLPEGFLERVGERGKIVEKWAPQEKILRHKNVGGFVSHCGWSSLMESIEFGVPIIAMPMHLDQPLNAKLVVELGVGAEIGRDEKGRFMREEIARVIRDVVVGKQGESLRRRVEEQRGNLRGTCEEEIDGVVQEIAQLCGKNIGTNMYIS